MANMTRSRKQITDLSEPLQIRELNRQIDWIYTQLLDRLYDKAIDELENRIKELEDSLVYPKSAT